MKEINVNVCLGTTCFVMGGTYLNELLEIVPKKYGDKVKVYTIGDFSKEICGGPHVERTGNMGHFKIKKEEAVSSGVRRIKAILE